jgi:hypothetical protein
MLQSLSLPRCFKVTQGVILPASLRLAALLRSHREIKNEVRMKKKLCRLPGLLERVLAASGIPAHHYRTSTYSL